MQVCCEEQTSEMLYVMVPEEPQKMTQMPLNERRVGARERNTEARLVSVPPACSSLRMSRAKKKAQRERKREEQPLSAPPPRRQQPLPPVVPGVVLLEQIRSPLCPPVADVELRYPDPLSGRARSPQRGGGGSLSSHLPRACPAAERCTSPSSLHSPGHTLPRGLHPLLSEVDT